jgi:transposase-like protein
MARGTNRADLVLPESHRQMLTELSGSRAAPAREVERAKILLRYAEGISISDIQRQVGVYINVSTRHLLRAFLWA